MEEIWKPIKDYEGLYEISNLGRVKSLKDNHGKDREHILKPIKDTKGYLVVNLSKNGKHKPFQIHRLVGFAFVDGYFEGAHIDHIDTNRLNNVWTNLRWVTQKENSNNELTKENLSKSKLRENNPMYGKHLSEEHKKKLSESHKGKNCGSNNGMAKKVYCVENDTIYNTIKEASEELGIFSSNIVAVCKGKLKQTKGYHFKYIEERN